MPALAITIVRTGDPSPWPELADRGVHHVTDGLAIAILEAGMGSGAPSVGLRIDLDDGNTVLAETSLALLGSAVIAGRAVFPEAFAGGPLDAGATPVEHTLARMRAWAAINPQADTQGLTDDEWLELARAAAG